MNIDFDNPNETDARWISALESGKDAALSSMFNPGAVMADFPAVVIVDRYVGEFENHELVGGSPLTHVDYTLGDGLASFRARVAELVVEGSEWFTSTTEAAIAKQGLDSTDPERASRLRAQNKKLVDAFHDADFFDNHVVPVMQHFQKWEHEMHGQPAELTADQIAAIES